MNADKIKNFFDGIRALIYPDRCPLCDIPVPYHSGVCPTCRETATVISGKRCPACGVSVRDCECKKRANFYTAITAPFLYKDVVRKGIKIWKFQNGGRNTRFFAKLIAACVKKDFGTAEFDFICFIPQTKEETQARGYNQSERLANEIGFLLGLPVEPVLVKIFETKRQHVLPQYLRSGNVFGVFDCLNGEKVKDKNILLIDDIKTSGKTLNECAKILRLYGAAKVYCAVIAIA